MAQATQRAVEEKKKRDEKEKRMLRKEIDDAKNEIERLKTCLGSGKAGNLDSS